MCKSVKGAAFFGSSIHVVAAFIFLVWFLFDTVITEVHINLWKCVTSDNDPPRQYNVLVHYLNLPFKFLYYACLCVTGIYIFRGVERSSPRVIKFALLVFVIVQIIALALFITISLNYWDDEDHNDSVVTVMDQSQLSQYQRKNTQLRSITSRLVDPNIPNGLIDQLEQNSNESEENGNYTINIEVISHTSDSKESGESLNGEEKADMKAVLESPLDFGPSTTTTPMSPQPPPLPPGEGPGPEAEVVLVKVIKSNYSERRKLSHNQLVSLVFQVFLVGFNALGSFIYTGILLVHLMTL